MNRLAEAIAPSAATPIRVLVADDHPILREGIVAIINKQADMTIVGEAHNGREAVALFRTSRPDVTLMDVQMPEMGGIEAIQTIRAEDPSAAIVVLTTYPGDSQALRALKAGASGYLLKSCIRKDLLATLRSVRNGARVISPEVAQVIATHALEEQLTDREAEILALIANGTSNKQVAWTLKISTDTVKGHLKTIFLKLAVTDRTQAVAVAIRRGVIDL